MNNLPPTMDALLLEEPGRLRLARIPVPDLEEGEVLIEVKAATTCGTDLKAFRRGHPQIPMPGPFGHEYSGVVASSRSPKFSIGDEVMGVHSAPCQKCFWCLRDQENLCESIMATKVLGSYAGYLKVPERIARLNLFRKPPELPFEEAALLEPLACVAEGLRGLDFRPDSQVLVVGPGAIGIMFVAALKAKGIGSVTLAGRNPERLKVGEQLGAKPIFLDTAETAARTLPGGGFDLVIECTGMVEVWERAPSWARRGGTVILFGGPPSGSKVTFDTTRLHYDQITLLSPFHFGTKAVRQAFDWLTTPGFSLKPLISGKRKLGEADQVFADLGAGVGLKYAFVP